MDTRHGKRQNIEFPGLDISEHIYPLCPTELFANRNKTAFEIGFGEGDFLIEMAKSNPDINYIGVEVKWKRVRKALKRARITGVKNIRLINMDANIAIEEMFSPCSLNQVYINFPDPWPKERHRKHRIINPCFLNSLSSLLKPEGTMEIASDHEEYISHILEAVYKSNKFVNLNPEPGYKTRLLKRPQTRYEREFREQGKEIFYLSYMKYIQK